MYICLRVALFALYPKTYAISSVPNAPPFLE